MHVHSEAVTTLPKIQRRMRTGTENSDTTKDTPSHSSIQMMCNHMIQQPACIKKKTLADFYVSLNDLLKRHQHLYALSDYNKFYVCRCDGCCCRQQGHNYTVITTLV